MKFTFVREINFKNFMDDDPANILNHNPDLRG